MAAARFLADRLASMVLVLLIISFVSFLIFYLLPSDPARLSCGRPCTPESLATARAFMGFDEPWYRQFTSFLGGIVAGRTFGAGPTAIHCAAPCFGYSFQQNAESLSLIMSRLPVTAPAFLVGLIGILIFGFTLDMVPTHGYVALSQDPVGWAWHLVLPWLVLAFLNGAIYARLTRGQMLEALSEDYIRTARAKGLTETLVVRRHALRNVLLPVVTVFGLDLGALLGGAVITERVFGMPGVGALMIDAVHALDLPLLLGCTLFGAALIVVANFLVDLLYGVLDPRARLI